MAEKKENRETKEKKETKKYIYLFEEGNKDMKEVLGGKGANLCEMTRIGLPVPAGFVISIDICEQFLRLKNYPDGVKKQVQDALEIIGKKMNSKLGDEKNPLLLSVRSGAKASMPGMMETILNLGLNEKTIKALIEKTHNERFVLDSYRRFIQMFGDVVLKIEIRKFEEILECVKETRGISLDTELNAEDFREIVKKYKELVKKETKKDFPENVEEQLWLSIDAVFNSWNSDRAKKYREINNLKGYKGTAVNIQAMVFGNLNEKSGTGVAFTRNPSNGKNEFYGEYLMNAQGEDVVAGIRTPKSMRDLEKNNPKIYQELFKIREILEKHYKDMQDLEFTIQEGNLYLLQTRNGKRTGQAAVKIAVDLVKEKLISEKEAILRINAEQLNQLLHKRIDPIAKEKTKAIGRGLPASPGAAVGKIVFNSDDAKILSEEKGEEVVLVRLETSPEDIEGMHVSKGILTARGGMTSHAAVVARGMGKCCISGCSELQIDEKNKKLKINGIELKEFDYITLDGTTGEFYSGKIPVINPELSGEFAELMNFAKKFKKLGVRANADNGKDAKIARNFGAEGIGLCRTEHMFFEGERINAMREMILAETEKDRRKALEKLLPYQRKDFEEIFQEMNNLPVIIRLLDPPLHEFLPKEDKEIKELTRTSKISEEKIRNKIRELHEFNPMLGFRGCRLGVVYPEISEMQSRAIFEAAINVSKRGVVVIPEIEVPNIIHVKEFKLIKEIIKKVAEELEFEGNYKIGTMIEFPRAALIADELAKESDFMSFGTNDLTQTTLGFSRDDAGRFIPSYILKNIFEKDPFQTIDQEGVGKIMKICVEKARSVKKEIDIGICGEHGGEPESIKFCHKIGLSNVSCSPFRVPIAILSAAQAGLE